MKFLLIIPPNITYDAFRYPSSRSKVWRHENGLELGVIVTDVPLGALTISSWLKKKYNAEVKILDFNILIHKTWNHTNSKDFSEWFKDEINKLDFQPDYIGFSSLFLTGYLNLLNLGKICREKFPKSLIMCGGNIATTMYKDVFRDDENVFDALCYGEGEKPLAELIESKDKQAYLKNSSSWVTREKVSKDTLFKHNFIEDLDEIPKLDYDAIELKDYHQSPTINAYTQIKDTKNYITYMTSRGCPFLCTFCSAHTVHGRKMRYFSLDRVKKELKDLTQKYNAKTLVIEDDHFMNNKERALSILSICRELNLVTAFPNALALYALDREVLESLRDTGVTQLTLAVESGSERVLKNLIKKPLKLGITKRVLNDCYDLNIYTDCNLIIGMPGETKKDIKDSREFLKDVAANWFRINVATPLSGSDMFNEAVKKNQIVGNWKEAGYKSSVIETEHFSAKEINQVAYELNLELNFVNNTDMQRSNYVRAAESFSNVLKLKKDHPFAMYYLGICEIKLGNEKKGYGLISKSREIFAKDPEWTKYEKKFNIVNKVYTTKNIA
jgi:radical SAM superfamily enzyme YgiQ (UPF0313 family)